MFPTVASMCCAKQCSSMCCAQATALKSMGLEQLSIVKFTVPRLKDGCCHCSFNFSIFLIWIVT